MVVFGCTLNDLAILYYKPVPTFLEKCFALIIEKGLDTEGIFRINGDHSEIQQLKNQIDATNDITFPENVSVFCVANIIFRFFESIKNHVLIDSRADEWKNAETKEQLKSLYEKLPLMNRALVSRLFGFLYIVQQHSDQNKMGSSNLAIQISPNLLEFKPQATENDPTLLSHQNFLKVVTTMIDEYFYIFESMLSIDKDGQFLSEEAFADSIGDICMEFFCKSSPVALNLKPIADEKHCRLNRNIPIQRPEYDQIMQQLLNPIHTTEMNSNENDFDIDTPIVI